jgi:hypothetical protein
MVVNIGPITMDFKELYMSFNKRDINTLSKVSKPGSPKSLALNRMEKLLKKGHF